MLLLSFAFIVFLSLLPTLLSLQLILLIKQLNKLLLLLDLGEYKVLLIIKQRFVDVYRLVLFLPVKQLVSFLKILGTNDRWLIRTEWVRSDIRNIGEDVLRLFQISLMLNVVIIISLRQPFAQIKRIVWCKERRNLGGLEGFIFEIECKLFIWWNFLSCIAKFHHHREYKRHC